MLLLLASLRLPDVALVKLEWRRVYLVNQVLFPWVYQFELLLVPLILLGVLGGPFGTVLQVLLYGLHVLF